MPLACASPVHVSPAIMRKKGYAQDYINHAAQLRDLLDFPSLPTDARSLSLSSNPLFRSLGGLLSHSADIMPSQEPIPLWILTSQINQRGDAVAIYQKARQAERRWLQCPARHAIEGRCVARYHLVSRHGEKSCSWMHLKG